MKYLKKFATHSEYESYISGSSVAYPNVSICEEPYHAHLNSVGRIIDPDNPPHDYSQDYLTFEITNDGYICFTCSNTADTRTIQYSKNGGEWTNLTSAENQTGTTAITVDGKSGTYVYGGFDSERIDYYWENGDDKLYEENKLLEVGNYVYDFEYETYEILSVQNEFVGIKINVVSGDTIQFRGDNASYCYNGNDNSFRGTTCGFKLKGNIMSLIDSTGFETATTLANECFSWMFYGCTGLTDASNLVLPATTLATACYSFMFMSCNSLTSAPKLPATTLAASCYWDMFHGCTSLTTAPELPATTLANECYGEMFIGCTGLTSAPELPAITLTRSCYAHMFENCRNLSYIKCLATDISAQNCTKLWVYGVASSGTFIKAANMSSWTTGNNGIPNNWTVEDAS